MSDPSRYRALRLEAVEVPIDPREVARLAKAGPLSGCAEAVDAAIAEARQLIEPRGIWTAVDSTELDPLFAEPTPLDAISRRGPCWAFVVTIGERLEERVQEHMEATWFLEGVLLDAAGSTAAEAVADHLQRLCVGESSAERFSPGYCGWVMASQPALFELVAPDDLGVSLLPSFLMKPLKSVSGLVVQAPEEALKVEKQECAACDARGCSRRQAAFAGGAAAIAG